MMISDNEGFIPSLMPGAPILDCGWGVPITVRHFDSLVQIERVVDHAFTLQVHQSLNLYAKGYHVQLDMMQRATTFVAK